MTVIEWLKTKHFAVVESDGLLHRIHTSSCEMRRDAMKLKRALEGEGVVLWSAQDDKRRAWLTATLDTGSNRAWLLLALTDEVLRGED
jgi:hypothetical protein